MDIRIAKQIGQRLAIKSGLIGLLIGYSIFGGLLYSWNMPILKAATWIFNVEYWYHLIVGAIGIATLWEAVFADVGVALLAILNAVRIQRKDL